MSKIKTRKNMVALLLLPVLFLFLISFSNAQNQVQISANINVNPSAQIQCVPNVLVAESNAQWIICKIELDGADVHNIDANTVRLGRTGSGCSIPADTSYFIISDGHAFARFNRNAADIHCFLPIPGTTEFQLVVSGNVGTFPFSGKDSLLYLKSCRETGHVHEMLANVSTYGGKINTLKGKTFDLDKYKPRTFSLNGFFDCRSNNRIVGDMKFFTSGILLEPTDINFLGLHFTYNKQRPVQISVIFDSLDNCYANKTPYFECFGKGTLFIDKEQPFKRERIDLDVLRVESDGKTASIQGGKYFNDIIDVDNLVVSKVTVRPSLLKK